MYGGTWSSNYRYSAMRIGPSGTPNMYRSCLPFRVAGKPAYGFGLAWDASTTYIGRQGSSTAVQSYPGVISAYYYANMGKTQVGNEMFFCRPSGTSLYLSKFNLSTETVTDLKTDLVTSIVGGDYVRWGLQYDYQGYIWVLYSRANGSTTEGTLYVGKLNVGTSAWTSVTSFSTVHGVKGIGFNKSLNRIYSSTTAGSTYYDIYIDCGTGGTNSSSTGTTVYHVFGYNGMYGIVDTGDYTQYKVAICGGGKTWDLYGTAAFTQGKMYLVILGDTGSYPLYGMVFGASDTPRLVELNSDQTVTSTTPLMSYGTTVAEYALPGGAVLGQQEPSTIPIGGPKKAGYTLYVTQYYVYELNWNNPEIS